MRYLSFIFCVLLFVACSSGTPENLPKQIDQLIANDNYTQALSMLDNANPDQTDADLEKLREKTHLNYGLYLELRGPEGSTMRDRMTSALEQFISVLEINPNNQKARSEIERIMKVYNTMPNKSPGKEIMADLRELGFDY
jgi:outer membrane protein assembly factor BamD (BamD/ComL family)